MAAVAFNSHVSSLYYNCPGVNIYMLYQRTENVNYFYCQILIKLVIEKKRETLRTWRLWLILYSRRQTVYSCGNPYIQLIENAFYAYLSEYALEWRYLYCIWRFQLWVDGIMDAYYCLRYRFTSTLNLGPSN